jgi:hypothetical protein
MSPDDKPDPLDRMVDAYVRMLERVDAMLEAAEKSAIPTLRKSLEQARDKAVELNELTREEAERVSGYVERDMKEAARFLSETGTDFGNWLKFDLKLIESRMLEMLANVADRTRVELGRLAENARSASYYNTGEITGPGTLVCTGCGKALHFHKTGHIPPCGVCRGTVFKRHRE